MVDAPLPECASGNSRAIVSCERFVVGVFVGATSARRHPCTFLNGSAQAGLSAAVGASGGTNREASPKPTDQGQERED
jgi:hypothetical protein